MRRKTHEEFIVELKLKNSNITVLSEYINCSTKIKAKCLKCNNVWETNPNSLLQGHGCPVCANNTKKTQERFESELKEYNSHIEVLGKYKNAITPLKVRCKICGNEWFAKPHRLLHGAQCNNCIKPHTSFMEQFILVSLKKVLGEEKVKSRNTSAIGVELDIYVPSYNLAIEPGSWLYHKNKINNLDLQKRNKCKEKGIKLITIYDTYPKNKEKPYSEDCYIFTGFLNEYNYKRLINLVKDIFNNINITNINLNWNEIANEAYEACHYNAHKHFLKELSKIAPNIIVLEKFKGSHTKILVKNKNCNHPAWEARPYSLLKGIGCPECGRITAKKNHTKTQNQFVEEIKAISPTIKILGKYIKTTERIDVKCEVCGNQWSPLAYSLLNGKGCPHCSALNAAKKRKNNLKAKSTLQFKNELKKINKNIEVLGEYINNKTKITVKCNLCNYKWNVVPASLLNGHNCPKCGKNKDNKKIYL